jgi:tetratricopeptide (TPR) repeat protein
MRALFGAARNWEALGNFKDAVELYKRVLDEDPTSPSALQKKRQLLEKAGLYAEAIDEYDKTGSWQDSEHSRNIMASLYYRLAVEQIKANKLDEAKRTLKESQRIKKYYVPNVLILANLHLKTGRERDAERLLEDATADTYSTILLRRFEEFHYGQAGGPEEKLEPVIDLYKELLNDDPNANHLRLALGKLYMKMEKYDDAEKSFLEFQSQDASIPQVHLLLADLYQQTGNVDRALEEYRISAELVDIKIADFKCRHCGAMYEYWADHCTSCGNWGTIEDIFYKRGPQAVLPELKQKPLPQLPTPVAEEEGEKVISAS